MNSKPLCINITCYPPTSADPCPEYHVWAFVPGCPDPREPECQTELWTHNRSEAIAAFQKLETYTQEKPAW